MASHSGRFVLRLPPDLHARARGAARRQSISLNEFCRLAVERSTDGTLEASAARPGSERFLDAARKLLGDDLEAVVLFGSQARGEARAGSDIDLLVVVSERREIDRSLYRLWDECNGATVVNPHFVHLPGDVFEAGSLWFEIAIEGIVLEDREGNVNRFLSRVRRAIANGQIRRGSVHGRPYWVKQEGGTDAQ